MSEQQTMVPEPVVEGDTVTLRRFYPVSADRVFRAWTDPARLARWFLPNERWDRAEVDSDLRPGGEYSIKMIHSDGDVFRNFGEYVEVIPDRKLSFTWKMQPGTEAPISPASLVTVILAAAPAAGGGPGTEFALVHARLDSGEVRGNVVAGWTGILETLEQFLSGEANFIK